MTHTQNEALKRAVQLLDEMAQGIFDAESIDYQWPDNEDGREARATHDDIRGVAITLRTLIV